jgi:hypothetical protein
MNLFSRILGNKKSISQKEKSHSENRTGTFEKSFLNDDGCGEIFIYDGKHYDNYLLNAWVNIAVNILIRNLARADFVLEIEGGGNLHQVRSMIFSADRMSI